VEAAVNCQRQRRVKSIPPSKMHFWERRRGEKAFAGARVGARVCVRSRGRIEYFSISNSKVRIRVKCDTVILLVCDDVTR
jgi:hypothetical protein